MDKATGIAKGNNPPFEFDIRPEYFSDSTITDGNR